MISAVKAKKYLGQHFLLNEEIALKISKLISKNNNVLEVGPGMGVLTKYLLNNRKDLKVVEIDPESIVYLKKNYPELEKNIINGDFLKLDISKIFCSNFSIIGNFPYNISSQILFKTFENKDKINELVGMFQKEVAERIACLSGKKRGILSVLIQTFYDVEYCFSVDEIEFSPPPKVKSGVIKITRNNREFLNCNEKLYKNIIKVAFNQRRKTLKNALKCFDLKIDENIRKLISLRAENLSVEDFIYITNNVKSI
tara:strand:- start:1160 stop:1924 length:765 start_codon:yes stop_codon:yes gene_type:complete